MSFLTTLLICILGAICVASAKEEVLPITSRITEAELADLRRRAEGCNANICFAFDGSSSISASEFQAQKLFIQDVVAVLGPGTDVEVAAVQYATSNSVITRLTPDLTSFFRDVNDAAQSGGGSALRRGIGFCTRELRRRSGEPMKMVLLGDGRSDRPAAALRRANRFRDLGGEVCVVGAGFADSEQLLALAGGDPDKVFEVDNFLDILDITFIIEGLVDEICGVEAAEV